MLVIEELKNELLDSTHLKEYDEAWDEMLTTIEEYVNNKAEVNAVYAGAVGPTPSGLNGPHVLNLILTLNKPYIKEQTSKQNNMAGFVSAMQQSIILSRVDKVVPSGLITVAVPTTLQTTLSIDTYKKNREEAMYAMAKGIIESIKQASVIPSSLPTPGSAVANDGSTGALTISNIT